MGKIWKLRKGRLIIGGDFTIVGDPKADLTSAVCSNYGHLNGFLHKHDLYDVWRCQHGSKRDYSYFSPPHKSYSRIEYFLTDRWTLQTVSSSFIDIIIWSDHAPVGIELNMTRDTRSPLWRLDSRILYNQDHVWQLSEAQTLFFDCNDSPDISRSTLWQTYKAYMRRV